MDLTTQLSFHDLVIGFKDKRLLEPINLSAYKGDLIALMGLNGTGKTTLFKTILQEIIPLGGAIHLNGNKFTSKEIPFNFGVVFTERIPIFGFSVLDMISMGRMPYTNIFGKLSEEDKGIVSHWIKELELTDIADHQINDLSDGQFQKVMIGRMLAQETPILLLDEPTAFLDVKNKIILYKLLKSLSKKHKKTIIVSTHDLEFCQRHCDKAWIVNQGKLEEKKAKEIGENDFIY